MSGRDECPAAEGFNSYHHCKKTAIQVLAGFIECLETLLSICMYMFTAHEHHNELKGIL